jgi:diguanylate cyclase (GGDEF)-like protein
MWLDSLTAQSGSAASTQLRARHVDGGWRWLELSGRNLTDHPAVNGVVINFRDITERHRKQEQEAYAARHDGLTGLANRTAFQEILTNGLSACSADGTGPALLFIDLDDFKPVNDQLGHDAGDQLLCAVADMIRRSIPQGASAARLGGDEFSVFVPVGGAQAARAAATRLTQEMKSPVEIRGDLVQVRASIGIASADGCGPGELLRRADLAMYRAKRAGGDEVVRSDDGAAIAVA